MTFNLGELLVVLVCIFLLVVCICGAIDLTARMDKCESLGGYYTRDVCMPAGTFINLDD